MGMDSLNGTMANIITGNGKKAKSMEAACGVLKKETLTLESGFSGKFKVKEFIQPQAVFN
jgi:hypothetical protein